MLVKNESDIIGTSLEYHTELFDRIYVFDNGSTDSTWEIVNEYSKKHPGIVPYKREDKDFRDSLRGEVFSAFRHTATPEDWWCRLDADEFYIDHPRDFLATVPRSHHVVWSIHLQYYFTEEDLLRWSGKDEDIVQADLKMMPRFYKANASEPRFFRHRMNLEWQGDTAWPKHMGIVHPKRIRLKHYQYRSPAQINRRLTTRKEAAKRGYLTFQHGLQDDWKEKISSSKDLHLDDHSGSYRVNEDEMPSHLESPLTRFVKYVMHGTHLWP